MSFKDVCKRLYELFEKDNNMVDWEFVPKEQKILYVQQRVIPAMEASKLNIPDNWKELI